MSRPPLSMRFAVPLVAALVLAACGQPVPPEKAAYIGIWRSAPQPERSMELVIDADGRVRYKRFEGRSSTAVDGPIKGFDGDHFDIGIGPISTRFIVSRPPQQQHGDDWKMTVDGVELIRR